MEGYATDDVLFQSTPLMRGETMYQYQQTQAQDISIHSPHARGDKLQELKRDLLTISIHSPHARGDSVNRR